MPMVISGSSKNTILYFHFSKIHAWCLQSLPRLHCSLFPSTCHFHNLCQQNIHVSTRPYLTRQVPLLFYLGICLAYAWSIYAQLRSPALSVSELNLLETG